MPTTGTKIGMLWFDNTPPKDKSISDKIFEAVEYYKKKYNRVPNYAYVHPSAVPNGVPHIAGLTVEASKSVMPNHVWVGVVM